MPNARRAHRRRTFLTGGTRRATVSPNPAKEASNRRVSIASFSLQIFKKKADNHE